LRSCTRPTQAPQSSRRACARRGSHAAASDASPPRVLSVYRSTIESFDVSDFDVIISSHHTVAKGVLTRADQAHVCYCHTPMRALWERPVQELATVPAPIRPAVAALFSHMRVWDAVSAARVQQFVANSTTTQRRIARARHR